MDGERFDRLARSLAVATSRRRVLRGLAAGMVGAVAGALGLRRAGAGFPPANCSAYGRVCTYTGCCRDGAECRCYANGHCRCVCPEGATFVAGACACAPPAATTGELSASDPTFQPCGATGQFPYDAHTFRHCGGPLTVGLRGAASGGGTLTDPFLDVFAAPFDPADGCANRVGVDDDGGCDNDSHLAFADLAAGTYVAVARAFASGQLGSYTLEFNTAPDCPTAAAAADKGPRA